VTEQALTTADQVNGYGWRGRGIVSAQASRQYDEDTRSWSDRRVGGRDPSIHDALSGQSINDFAGVVLNKQHGKWSVASLQIGDANFFAYAEAKRLDCAKVPKRWIALS
jgi:hypothetical protein